MKTIKTILFPTDFSDSSAVARKHALLHSDEHNAKVVIVHVDHRMLQNCQFLIMAMTPAQICGALRERVEQHVTHLSEARRDGVRCDVLIRDGEPSV